MCVEGALGAMLPAAGCPGFWGAPMEAGAGRRQADVGVGGRHRRTLSRVAEQRPEPWKGPGAKSQRCHTSFRLAPPPFGAVF